MRIIIIAVSITSLISFLIAGNNLTAGDSHKETEPSATANVQAKPLKDGKYEGKAKGYKGEISVEVEILAGKIKNVKVISHKENRPKTALKTLPSAVIEKQSADNIDSVTGATYTSKGFLQAVKNALEKAAKN